MAEQQKNSQTRALGVNVQTELNRAFKKRCKELKHKERDVVEALLQLFLDLKDENSQSKLVRGEAKIIPTKDGKDGVTGRILSGMKSIML